MAKKEEPIFTNANDYLFHCLDVLKADKGVSENTIIIMFMQYARLASNDGWVRYNWSNKASRPKESGRYEVYREGAKKQHYEVWNGSGWAYNNNDITHWRPILTPNI